MGTKYTVDNSGDVTAVGTLTIGSLGQLTVDAAGVVVTLGTITAPTFVGNLSGNATSATTAGSASAGTLTGTTLASNVINSSLTSLGTLGSLSVTGLTSSGTFSGNGAALTFLTPANISAGTAGINISGNAATAATATTATNIASGANGSIPYQTASGITAMLPIGAATQVLTVVSGAPSWQPSAGGGGSLAWTSFVFTNSSFSTAATSNSISLFSLPAFGCIHAVVIQHSASFTGGGITAYTISVGLSGNNSKYASAFDVFQASSSTILQASQDLFIENTGGSTAITVTATSTGANLNAATTGSVTVWVLTSTI